MYKNNIKQNTKKLLACLISASLTGIFSTSISYASDIEIYKNPTVKGHTIVMLALDNSYSMGLTDSDKNKSRLAILKDSLRDVLQGVKDVNGNYTTTPLPDNTIVGLSTFGTGPRHGRIVVPARALNTMVASKSQRQVLLEEINKINSDASTPTSL
ncbi:hypothetical protein SKM62_12270, partial [Acinetobacter faecalis]|nr:hypothetical protein [Acinetobacter faecalis]